MRAGLIALSLVAACGDDGIHNLPDAPNFPDGPPADSPDPAPVTVTLIAAGQPVVGADVIYQRPDGSVAESVKTDASGTATGRLDDGGTVTAVALAPTQMTFGVALPNHSLSTWDGVKPGDHLVWNRPGRVVGQPLSFNLAVPNEATAFEYQVFTSCGQVTISVGTALPAPTQPHPVTLSGCPTKVDFLVVARGANGQTIGAFYAPDQTITPNGTLTLDGTYAPFASFAATITNMPGSPGSLTFGLASTNGSFFSTISDFVFANNNATAQLSVPVATNSIRLLSYVFDVIRAPSRYAVQVWGPASPTFTQDFATIALHEYMTEPMADPATRAIAWTESSTGKLPNIVESAIHVDRPAIASWDWQIVAPRTAMPKLVFPDLPAVSGIDFNFEPTDSTGVGLLVNVDASFGYDGIRPVVFGGDITPLLATPGQTVTVIYSNP